MIHRNLRHTLSHLCHQIYHTTSLPKLKYCCAVWDPYHLKYQQNLQKFGAIVISHLALFSSTLYAVHNFLERQYGRLVRFTSRQQMYVIHSGMVKV